MDEGFLRRSQLCRRIQALAVKDSRRRSAPLLQRLLADRRTPYIVRVEAARTLARWDVALVHAVAGRIAASRWEDPLLRERLREFGYLPN